MTNTPPEKRYVAYYRVSTDRQGRSGLGLEAQRHAVAAFLENGSSWERLAEFTEVESGKRTDRPELAKAIAKCRRLKAVLIIAKLDRLARNVAFIANLLESGVDFKCCDMPDAGRLTIHIMASFAEHEHDMISTRTKEALAAAKARGVKLGAPDPTKSHAACQATIQRNADSFAANAAPIIADIQKSGITSLRGIAEALNARGIATARGGTWAAPTVRNVLRRAKPQS